MSQTENNPAAAPEAIDASCRIPGLLLIGSALAWLVAALGIGFLSTMNFHAPTLLADCPWFTYGHLVSASDAAFLFGFGGNAALGVTLWMLSRLRGAELRWPASATLGAALWNVGVTAGVIGAFRGDATGYEGIDIPVYAIRILVLGGGIMALSGVLTYFARRQVQLYVSSWYLIAGLIVLPWVLLTVYLALGVEPLRGVAQATTQWWAVASLNQVWLGSVGLAALFYFVPKIIDAPLYSRQLAGFGFWALLFIGGWTGLHAGAPVPVWMVKVGHFAGVMFIFPLFAVFWNIHRTICGRSFSTSRDTSLAFLGVAYFSYLASGVLLVLLPYLNATTHFTLFNDGHERLFQFGFFAMAMLGAVYYIVPRLAGADWDRRKWLTTSFYLGMIGLLLYVVPLLFGGWSQGKALATGGEYLNLPESALMSLRIATLGELMMLGAAVVAFINFKWHMIQHCCDCCNPLEILRMFRESRAKEAAGE